MDRSIIYTTCGEDLFLHPMYEVFEFLHERLPQDVTITLCEHTIRIFFEKADGAFDGLSIASGYCSFFDFRQTDNGDEGLKLETMLLKGNDVVHVPIGSYEFWSNREFGYLPRLLRHIQWLSDFVAKAALKKAATEALQKLLPRELVDDIVQLV